MLDTRKIATTLVALVIDLHISLVDTGARSS